MILAAKVMRYGRETLSLGRKILKVLTHSVVRPVRSVEALSDFPSRGTEFYFGYDPRRRP